MKSLRSRFSRGKLEVGMNRLGLCILEKGPRVAAGVFLRCSYAFSPEFGDVLYADHVRFHSYHPYSVYRRSDARATHHIWSVILNPISAPRTPHSTIRASTLVLWLSIELASSRTSTPTANCAYAGYAENGAVQCLPCKGPVVYRSDVR